MERARKLLSYLENKEKAEHTELLEPPFRSNTRKKSPSSRLQTDIVNIDSHLSESSPQSRNFIGNISSVWCLEIMSVMILYISQYFPFHWAPPGKPLMSLGVVPQLH